MGRFAFADNGDGTMFAVVVGDDLNPRPYGEKWGSTHLLLWDVATGWERLRIDREMHSYFGSFAMVAITRDGRLAATVSENDRVEIWNGFNGYQLDGFDTGRGVSAIAFSNDGTMLATGHEDGSILLWDTRVTWGSIGHATSHKPEDDAAILERFSGRWAKARACLADSARQPRASCGNAEG